MLCWVEIRWLCSWKMSLFFVLRKSLGMLLQYAWLVIHLHLEVLSDHFWSISLIRANAIANPLQPIQLVAQSIIGAPAIHAHNIPSTIFDSWCDILDLSFLLQTFRFPSLCYKLSFSCLNSFFRPAQRAWEGFPVKCNQWFATWCKRFICSLEDISWM